MAYIGSTVRDTDVFALKLSKNDIVGTVAQSGGIPTGAIIETGTNSNGTYTRFADGTQICGNIFTVTPSAWTTGDGSLRYCTVPDIAFPANFAATPWSINITARDGNVSGRAAQISYFNMSTTGLSGMYAINFVSASTSNFSFYYCAIGKWF